MYVEARRKSEGKIIISKNLPKQIHILYSIQYKTLAEKIKTQLQKNHKILGFNQVLGCSKIKLKATPLLIGSGRFHALQVIDRPGYIYEHGKLIKITKNELLKLKKVQKGKLSRFLSSENIGIIFSKKPGQNNLSQQKTIINKLKNKYKNKNFYAFISDNINLQELENFNIDFWINTSCPGLELDSKDIINYKNLQL
tara:strand:+ start:2898 stop:3488 length:591 start_codon:yes stop_codon:yes gene_type:complete